MLGLLAELLLWSEVHLEPSFDHQVREWSLEDLPNLPAAALALEEEQINLVEFFASKLALKPEAPVRLNHRWKVRPSV
jgi:hypothetical protein